MCEGPRKPTTRTQPLPSKRPIRLLVLVLGIACRFAKKKLPIINRRVPNSHCIHADRAIKAFDVLELLQEAIERHEAPKYIRSDNGPEFIAGVIQRWLREHQVKTSTLIRAAREQNRYAESFNGRFRTECLNQELLYVLSQPTRTLQVARRQRPRWFSVTEATSTNIVQSGFAGLVSLSFENIER